MRAKDDRLYEIGWEDGYKICQQRSEQTKAAFESLNATSRNIQTIGQYGY